MEDDVCSFLQCVYSVVISGCVRVSLWGTVGFLYLFDMYRVIRICCRVVKDDLVVSLFRQGKADLLGCGLCVV